jgi:hypothetical protein
MLTPGAEAGVAGDQTELRDRRMPGVAGARFTVRLPAADAAPAKGAPLGGRRA